MESEVLLDLIRKHDPSALRVALEDRINYYLVKRVCDFMAALVLLILFLPLMMLIGVLIFVYSPGPVFFVQELDGSKRDHYNGYSPWKRINFR